MILTKDLKVGKDGQILKTQKVDFKCDRCGIEYERIYFKALKQPLYCRKCNASINITKWNLSHKGKTNKEFYGKEKAEKMSNSAKNRMIFRRNYGDLKNQTWSSYNFKQRGKTFEQRFGNKKAKEIKNKISQSNIGIKNPMFGKPAPQGSGNGWSGWFNDFYFRSLLELSFLVRNENLNIKSAEKINIKYNFNGTCRTYHPDFLIDNNCLIEIKPFNLINTIMNKAKFEAAKQYCFNENLTFKVLTEKDIKKLSDNEIEQLYKVNKIRFIDRYELLYKEKHLE